MVGSASETREGAEMGENRRPLTDLSDFTVSGGEVNGSESGAVRCGERSHDRCEKATRRENGRSQRI